MPDPAASGILFKSLAGGFLAQSRDAGRIEATDLKVVTRRAPDERETADLLFAFAVCKHVKSNAIVYVKDGATVGIGAGQMSRVDSARIAAWKAREEIGRASCRERVCQYVYISVVAVSLKKNTKTKTSNKVRYQNLISKK